MATPTFNPASLGAIRHWRGWDPPGTNHLFTPPTELIQRPTPALYTVDHCFRLGNIWRPSPQRPRRSGPINKQFIHQPAGRRPKLQPRGRRITDGNYKQHDAEFSVTDGRSAPSSGSRVYTTAARADGFRETLQAVAVAPGKSVSDLGVACWGESEKLLRLSPELEAPLVTVNLLTN